MARRYDQYYRVKPRDNLGDPEYWNRRFEDVDRRVSSTEDQLGEIDGLTAYIEGLALDRLNLVLHPALEKVTLVSEQGWLLAHSISSATLIAETSSTFAIHIAAERELFAPSPFMTISREGSSNDYAFARTIDYDKASGQLVLEPLQVFGNPGPHNDWVIYTGSAISIAVEEFMITTMAARDAAIAARNVATANAATTTADKAAVTTLKSDTQAAATAAALSAAAAALFDPSSYISKDSTGTYNQIITFGVSPIVPTASAADNTQKAASTAFVKTAIANLVNGAGTTLDTLNEIAAALGNDANYAATITAALGNRLRVDTAAQGLNGTQQANARTNLALGTAAVKNVANLTQVNAGVATDVLDVATAWSAGAWVNLGNKTGAVTIDMATGSRFYMVATGNLTITVSNQKSGQPLDLAIYQDATGNRTVSWNAMFYWPDATVPTIKLTASGIAVLYSGVYHPNGWFMGAGWKVN